MKTKIATASVNRKDKRRKINKVIRQQAELIAKATKPRPTTMKTKIIAASSVAPKAFHPLLVHVMLVYLKWTPAREIVVIANTYILLMGYITSVRIRHRNPIFFRVDFSINIYIYSFLNNYYSSFIYLIFPKWIHYQKE